MGASDGSIPGLTEILDQGPDNARLNIVLVKEVSATSPAGHRVTRFRHMTGLSFDPRTGPRGSGGGSTQDPCREIRELIRRLGVALERCCCKERPTA